VGKIVDKRSSDVDAEVCTCTSIRGTEECKESQLWQNIGIYSYMNKYDKKLEMITKEYEV
jgi:hypothetical protein